MKEIEMSNAMKYIKSLEAAGFERKQAEAQVQMVLDAIEADLATKSDLTIFQERIEGRFERRLLESEFRITTRLGFLVISTTTIAVAVLTWLIKI
jgi:excinuclease UvrABC ATPase subunit